MRSRQVGARRAPSHFRRATASPIRHFAGAALLFVAIAGCGEGDSANDGGPVATFDLECRVRLAITAGELRSVAQGTLDYSRVAGHAIGAQAATRCTRLDDRIAVIAVNQCRGENGSCLAHDPHELFINMQTHAPVSAPVELVDCRFAAASVLTEDDFEVVDVIASDEDVQPATPPDIEVASVDCDDPLSTTTTLPVPGPCDGVVCATDEACVDGACVTTDRYLVELQTDFPALYGAIDFDVYYDCSEGAFDGDFTDVACRLAPGLNLFYGFNDLGCEAEGGDPYLAVAAISAYGWPGPGPLMSCEYTRTTGGPAAADAFRIEMDDAVTADGKPLAKATVSVRAVQPLAP